MSALTEERIHWISPFRLAKGKITVIDGDPSVGKSTMLFDWIGKLSSGRPLPDGEVNDRTGVVMMSAEDDPSDTMLPRLLVAGGDPDEVLILNEVPEIAEDGSAILNKLGLPAMRWLGLPDDIDLIEQAVINMNAAVIVIDPIMAFLSPDVSSNSDQDVRRALSPLALMAQRTGVAVILVRHLNKSGGVKALYRGGGSIGIIGLARIGLLLGRAKDDPELRVLATVKNNIGPNAPSLGFKMVSVPGTDVARMEYVGEVAYTADELLLGESISNVEADEKDEAVVWLEGYLTPSPRLSADVMREGMRAGFSQRSLKEAKVKLGVKLRKEGYQGSWYWALPAKGLYLVSGDNEEAI